MSGVSTTACLYMKHAAHADTAINTGMHEGKRKQASAGAGDNGGAASEVTAKTTPTARTNHDSQDDTNSTHQP